MICSCLTCSDHAHHPLIEKKKSNYWSTPTGITRRINYLAQEFTYMTINGAIKLYGNTQGVKWLQWLTVGDDRVCPICDKASAGGRSGYYKSSWFMPAMPVHPGCRCQWTIYYDHREEAI
jgi:hypothetical protein